MEEKVQEEKMEEQTMQSPNKPVAPNPIWKTTTIVLLGAILIAVLAGGAYFLGTKNSSQTSTQNPTPTIASITESAPTPTLEPTKTIETKSFSSVKFSGLSFSGYLVNYPADWTLKEDRDDSVPMSTVTLTKQGYILKIFQGATGGAQCIYEGSMPEGPASDYRTNKYTDLITGFGTLRQTENPANGKMAYTYCQKNTSDGSFGQPTNVGHMSVTTGVATPDEKIISEIETIVKSIKTL